LAAKTPHKAIDTALLVPEIIFTFLLPHFGHFIDVSIGSPQLGQAVALLETSLPQLGHLISAIFSLPF
jgi:hypothetical protein